MKNLGSWLIVGILVLSGASFALGTDASESGQQALDRDYTHTVMVEVGTATWCPSCPASNSMWHTLYESGTYDFEYTELVYDMNPAAQARFYQFNPKYVPTSYWDGGQFAYPGTSQSTFISYLNQAGARVVPDLYATMTLEWLGNARIDVSVSVQNNETAAYNGKLLVYVVEKTSTLWRDYSGNWYNHAFLSFAFNKVITIPASGTYTDNTVWDGTSICPQLSSSNTQVILCVVDDEAHQGYSDPPSGNPFSAYYIDETLALSLQGGSAPLQPDPPQGPTSGVTNVEYTYTGVTTNPTGNDLYYLFDWGDGTDSGWIGPYPSGSTAQASHAWINGGTYPVKVKAKEVLESPWSEPLDVTIEGASVSIAAVSGGLFKVSVVLHNGGSAPLEGVNWRITLHGGALTGTNTTGENLSIPGSGNVTVKSGFIIGFGSTSIKVEAWVTDGSMDMWAGTGKVLLFFVKVNPA